MADLNRVEIREARGMVKVDVIGVYEDETELHLGSIYRTGHVVELTTITVDGVEFPTVWVPL